jgi:hypothetical protein
MIFNIYSGSHRVDGNHWTGHRPDLYTGIGGYRYVIATGYVVGKSGSNTGIAHMTDTDHSGLRDAIDAVDREIECVSDERAAFDRFRARLTDIEPVEPSRASSADVGISATAVSVQRNPASTAPLRAVRTAYRETVMAVPHFDREYGETLETNIATEFGAEVASQVVGGRQLTPPLYRALLRGSETASDEREQFCRTLERERESVATVRQRLADVDRRLDDIDQRLDELDGERGDAAAETRNRLDARLDDLEAVCADVAADRQDLLHCRPEVRLSGVTGTSLNTYLYGEFDASCPALAAITARLDRVLESRIRCLR